MADSPSQIVNGMTVDVEDYVHVGAFADRIAPDDWDAWPSRVEANTERLLALFETADVRATFFVLGWVAERFPDLVRRIVAAGHEVASHGCRHERVDRQGPARFREDVRRSKAILEDLAGTAVLGFRAANFSVGAATPWAFPVLAEEGFRYGSSVNPIRHDHYGWPAAPLGAFRPEGADLVEIPVAATPLGGWRMACGGGGWFRLYPYALSRALLRRVNRGEGRPAVFYIHPWEIDPDQPRVSGARRSAQLRHRINLGRTEARLRRLFADFRWGRMDELFLAGAPSTRRH